MSHLIFNYYTGENDSISYLPYEDNNLIFSNNNLIGYYSTEYAIYNFNFTNKMYDTLQKINFKLTVLDSNTVQTVQMKN